MDNTTTAKTCTRCGEAKPVSAFYLRNGKPISRCKGCVLAGMRKYHAENREKRSESNRAWREANPEKHRSNARRWYRENRERALARTAKHQRENRERYREFVRRNYEKNRESRIAEIAQYRRDNSDWFRQYNRLKSSRRRALEKEALIVPFTRDQLEQRIAYYGGKCWMCGGEFHHIDHVKPLSGGGAHTLSNLRPACAPCNQAKSNQWPWPLRKAE